MGAFTSGTRAYISKVLCGECDRESIVPRNLDGAFVAKPLNTGWSCWLFCFLCHGCKLKARERLRQDESAAGTGVRV